jgi:thiamine biosynthesis protein ThiS
VNVLLNGEPTSWAVGTTVSEVVEAVVGAERGVAVSVDREVVPRSKWRDVQLREGALVEVLVAASGG